jgi:response regulator RpfG family c-di-GMP phosphodiesterase
MATQGTKNPGASDTGRDGNKVNVLVVDDTRESLTALEALLAGLDRQIIKASSGEEALKCLLHEDVGLILLDVKMAGLDGYQTAAIIRERDRTRNVPIIFLTAYHKDERDVARGYAVGAADYVFKPVMPDILRPKVDYFVELAKRQDALRRANEELAQAKEALQRNQAELERRVQERTAQLEAKVAELQHFEEVVIGRELKMIELEREVARLRQQVPQR